MLSPSQNGNQMVLHIQTFHNRIRYRIRTMAHFIENFERRRNRQSER